MQTYDHWIDGQAHAPRNRERLDRMSPASGKKIASTLLGTSEDMDLAVAAARRAFDSGIWSRAPGSHRGEVLARLADLILAHLEDLAQLEAIEAGKPITAARMEIGVCVTLTRFAASLAWNVTGRLVTDGGPDKLGMVMHQPRGVAGLIVAWNYPALCLMQKLPYALAAGCAVVVKPSEFTPGTTAMIAKLAEQAGVPKGQINIVNGTGDAVGEAMTSHPGVDMISFTGSSRVGRHVAAKCGAALKRCSLELGGKGSNIIFADADIDRAVEATYIGFTFNKGEECCSCARILVENSALAEFTEKLIARCAATRLGDPLDALTTMGPMIHEAHMNKVLGHIAQARVDGARVLVGGARADAADLTAGLFVPPTLFADATPDMAIFQEEIFGPVACLMGFDTLDQAVSIANDTAYGLANGVWSTNIDKAMAVTRRLRSGMVYVNTYFETLPQLPLGGMKQSGSGHENGVEGLQEFLETRSAFVKLRVDF
jgi:betaine-aldehyde dehydrogenase